MDMIRVFKGNDTVFTSNGDKIIHPIDAVIHKNVEEEYLELDAPLEYVGYLIQDNILVVDTLTGKKAYRIHNPEVGKTVTVRALLIWQENNPSPSDRGVAISHGKNLKDCKVSENWDDVVTKIIPIGYEGATLPERFIETVSPHQRVYERMIEFDLSKNIEETVEGLKDSIEEYTSEITNLNTSRTNLETRITTIGATIELLTTEISTINDRIAELGDTEPELKEKEILEAQVTELGAQVEELEDEKVATEEALSDTENDITTATNNLSAAQSSYTTTIINDLRSQAQSYLNNNLYPHINYELDAHLEGITEVGDTVKVKHEQMKIDMLAYVTAYEYSLMADKYIKIEFGTQKIGLKSYINELESRIYSVSNALGSVSTLIEQMNDQIVLKIDSNGRIGLFRLGRDAYGTEVYIKADNIRLEGLITANGNFKVLEDGSIEAVNGKFKGDIEALTGEIAGFAFTDDKVKGGLYYKNNGKFFRVSPLSSYTGEGGHDARYASIDLGTVDLEGGINTNIHLRNDGYARFGLVREGGYSVRINDYLRGEEGTDTILYSQNFWIGTDGVPHIKNSPDVQKGASNIDITYDIDGRITNLLITNTDDTTSDIDIVRDAQGRYISIGDTIITHGGV